MTDAPRPLRRARIALGVFVAVAATTVGIGDVVSAHTDFESSVPTDGAVVDAPLTEVVVNFTNPAVQSGDGFEVIDPAGEIRAPSAVDETDGTSFVLTFDPALEAGAYGVRWEVQAGDAHPLSGSFRFEVTGSTTETTPAAGGGTAAPVTTVVAGAHDMDDMDDMDADAHEAMSDEMEAFLSGGSAGGDSTRVGRIGRTISILGTIFGVGLVAALVWTIRGRREELDTQLGWVRLAGLVVLTGGLIEYAALVDTAPGASTDTLLTTKAGLATALKMVGGLAVMVGFRRNAGTIVRPAHSLSAAVTTELPRAAVSNVAATPRAGLGSDDHRWTPTASAAVGLGGYALVMMSFWFDGHTVSKGPWPIHAAVDLVHVGAAAVWAGGVFAMTTVAWMRRRRSERAGLAEMVVRFSTVATVSLVAVIAAGLAMTFMILDAPGDLFGTAWGRMLVAKTVAVAVAAGLGAYNHFRLRPALEQRPDDPALAERLRVALTIESAVFVAVVVLTAVLVSSAT